MSEYALDRIVADRRRYELLATGALYESEFETVLLQASEELFPGFVAVPFKTTIHSDYGEHRPDLALIDKEYRSWWVVEVERADHDLYGHVVPQVLCFSTGAYGEAHVRALSGGHTGFVLDRLSDMMKGDPPRVLVVCDRWSPDWDVGVRGSGGHLMSVSVFRSQSNHLSLAVRGGLPERLQGVVSMCRRDPVVPSMLRISSPSALPVRPGERVEIAFGDGIALWHRLDMREIVMLAPVGANFLPTSVSEFRLVYRGKHLALEPS